MGKRGMSCLRKNHRRKEAGNVKKSASINVIAARKSFLFVGAVLVDFKFVLNVLRKTNGALVTALHGSALTASAYE